MRKNNVPQKSIQVSQNAEIDDDFEEINIL